jgi:hypothetical protein
MYEHLFDEEDDFLAKAKPISRRRSLPRGGEAYLAEAKPTASRQFDVEDLCRLRITLQPK